MRKKILSVLLSAGLIAGMGVLSTPSASANSSRSGVTGSVIGAPAAGVTNYSISIPPPVPCTGSSCGIVHVQLPTCKLVSTAAVYIAGRYPNTWILLAAAITWVCY